MTWFRVGGAGIPAALKNAMNAVFNKKFGTTGQNYPPNQWPDEVNLMGPLPEKTIVSSSICSFSDGADDVPIKNWLVTLPASLDGYSEVNGTQTGRNLLPNEKYQGASTRVNIGQTDDGYSLHLKAGTYTLSATSLVQMRAYYRTSTGGSNVLIWSTYGTSGSGMFTLSEDSDVRIWLYNGDDGLSVSDVQTFQLEVGSTATAYEAYSAPTTYTASLGRTIYGGEVDIVKGVGSEQGYKVVVDGTNLYFAKAGNYYNSYPRTLPTLGNPWKLAQSDEISFGYNSNYGGFIFLTVARAEEFGLYSAEEVNAYFAQNPTTIILNLATPTDFTFDGQEIPTRLGVNNFWSDSGDTEVTYRADISLALQALQGSRSLSASLMRSEGPDLEERSEDPEEVSEPEENIQNTEEQEGEDDAR